MKKRITIAIILVLILSVSVGALTGCDEIFHKNEDRDAKQIVATVTYNNQIANVYKYEMESSFNAYVYYYVSYYGMSYQEAADYIVKSLAQRELLVLFAKEYIADAENKGAPELCTLKDLLSLAEYNKAIEDVNADLLSSLESTVQSMITEDNYNSSPGSTEEEEEEDNTATDKPVRVKFDSMGGSNVDMQTIQNGTKATEPADPTKEGYTFYGWYETSDFTGDEFNFKSAISIPDYENAKLKTKTLYAKWVEYTAPRTTKPIVEEEEEFDPDAEITEEELSPKFFTDEYKATIDFSDKDFVENIIAKDSETPEQALARYIEEGIAKLKSNMTANYMSYDSYLENEMKSLLITKLERLIAEDVAVTDSEIEAEWNRIAAANRELFGNSTSDYESALKSSLTTTYFQKFTSDSYGFVANILLKLDDESVKKLTDMMSDVTGNNAEIVKLERNRLIQKMTIKVSNPDYSAEADVDYGKDADGNDIEIRDPMTDPNNKYNGISGEKALYEFTDEDDNVLYDNINSSEDYNKLIEFKYDDEKKEWSIVYNCHEAPSMAYLLDKMPAFSVDGKIGIVEQIFNTFEAVTAAVNGGKLSHIEGVYWLRELATAWLYLVGDDSGSVTTDSNNNGLGYLVSPEGEESGFIDSFTEQARALIKKGAGSYSVNGNLDGSYVIGDSFIDTKNTSNAYAGVFVLLATHVVWDTNSAYTVSEDEDGNLTEEKLTLNDSLNGVLPLDYIVSYGKTLEDCVTIRDQIRESLLDAKKADKYNLIVNTFGLQHVDNIVYNAKAYKSLWKDLD